MTRLSELLAAAERQADMADTVRQARQARAEALSLAVSVVSVAVDVALAAALSAGESVSAETIAASALSSLGEGR